MRVFSYLPVDLLVLCAHKSDAILQKSNWGQTCFLPVELQVFDKHILSKLC